MFCNLLALGVRAQTNATPIVRLAVIDGEASEKVIGLVTNTAQFMVYRTGATNSPLNVRVLIGGTASASDYTGVSADITIPAGTNSQAIVIRANDDSLVEGAETVTLQLTDNPGSPYIIDVNNYFVQAVIQDDDFDGPLPVVRVSVTDAQAVEALSPTDLGQFLITRTGPTINALSVLVAISGTAHSNSDFVPLPSAVLIPAGASSQTVTVQPINDGFTESTETVILRLTNNVYSAYTIDPSNSWGQVLILDDDVAVPSVSIAASVATISEGAGGSMNFTVTRSTSLTAALTVELRASGTAVAGVDYLSSVGTNLTIPAGASSAVVTVYPINDTLVEPDKTLILQVTNRSGSGYLVNTSKATAQVTILDDDSTVPLPQLSIVATDAEATEGLDNGATNNAVFTITRSGTTNVALTVALVISGTASNGIDYTALPATVSFPSGTTSRQLVVHGLEDSLVEGPETVVIRLTNSSATPYDLNPGSFWAQATILDKNVAPSPPPPMVTIMAADAEASETVEGEEANTAEFIITRTGDQSNALDVTFVIYGSAINGVDYVEVPSTVTIPAGEASYSLVIQPLDDALVEGPETVMVRLTNNISSVYRSDLEGYWATATILDNDVAPPPPAVVGIYVTDAEAAEGTNTAQINTASFSIRRSGPTNNSLTVVIATEGTASNDLDYVSLKPAVTIPAGAHEVAVLIKPINDNLVEGTETVVVRLVPPAINADSPYAPVGQVFVVDPSNSVAQAVIYDRVVAPPPLPVVSIVVTDAEAAEAVLPGVVTGVTNTAAFTISRTGDTTNSLSVSIVVGGSASNGADYAFISGTVVIPAGASSRSILIQPHNDTLVEGPETVMLRLTNSNTSAYAINFSNFWAEATIVDDDVALPPPLPQVSIVATDAEAAEGGNSVQANTAALMIRRSGPTNLAVNVRIAIEGTAEYGVDYARFTSSGAISNGVDYLVVPTSVVIPAGATSVSLLIQPLNDNLVEGTETVIVRLLPFEDEPYLPINQAYNVDSSNAVAQAVILDAVTPPPVPVVSIVATDGEAAEGAVNGVTNTAAFTVSRTGDTNVSLVVALVMEGTASNGVDYEVVSNVKIPAGARSVPVIIRPLADNLVEGTETVIARLSYVPLGLPGNLYPIELVYNIDSSNALAQAVILDAVTPPPAPVVSIVATDAEAAESAVNGVTNTAAFTVSRTGDTNVSLSVKVVFGGTASNGVDYTVLSSMVTFPAGTTTRTLLIQPVNDSLVEGTETVVVRLTNNPAAAYAINPGNSWAQAKILDNDFSIPNPPPGGSNNVPVVTVVAISRYATEQFTNTGVFRIARPGSLDQALTVAYGISGTASNGVDYVQLPSSVTIPAGSDHVDLVVQAYDDNLVEGPESVTLTLNTQAAPSSTALRTLATVMILDHITMSHPGGVLQSVTEPPQKGLLLDRPGQIAVIGDDGQLVVVEVSSNLSDWDFLTYGFIVNGRVQFDDLDADVTGMRFYRHVSINPPE